MSSASCLRRCFGHSLGVMVALIVAVAVIVEPTAQAAERSARGVDEVGQGYTDYMPMKVFEPYAGKIWEGTGKDPAGEGVTDIARWEFIVGGRILQVTHSIGEGAYGGRTIYFYDEAEKKYLFHYFTTAGFHTLGEINVLKNGIESVEDVRGHETITKVKGLLQLTDEGFQSSSTYLSNGEWIDGHIFTYSETSTLPSFENTPTTYDTAE